MDFWNIRGRKYNTWYFLSIWDSSEKVFHMKNSMTVIWIRDGYSAVSPGAVLFTPFAIIALWSIVYLWKFRRRFRDDG